MQAQSVRKNAAILLSSIQISPVEGQLDAGHLTNQQHGTEAMSQQGYDNTNWHMRTVAKKKKKC